MDPFLNNNGESNREQNLGAQTLENMPSFEEHMERATKDAETERLERNRIHNLASGLMSFSEIKDSELLERGEKALAEVWPILTLLSMVALSSKRGEAIEFPVYASEDFFKAAEGTSVKRVSKDYNNLGELDDGIIGDADGFMAMLENYIRLNKK